MYFLDKFLKDLACLPYLFQSAELQLFLRPPQDVIKSLEALPRISTEDLLARFRKELPIQETNDDLKIKQYNEGIQDFVKECKDVLDHLRRFKKQIKMIVPIKEQEVIYNREFVDFLVKYEEINLKKPRPDDPFIALLVG